VADEQTSAGRATRANLSDVEGYAVIDLRSGRLLHQGTGTVPELLVPNRR
jgi:hypothetical protein